MEIEAQSILAAAGRVNSELFEAVDLILKSSGRAGVTGRGKAGHAGRKTPAPPQTAGTPAVFLHPSEAIHGDLGVCQQGDVILVVSKSGTTAELLSLMPVLRHSCAS